MISMAKFYLMKYSDNWADEMDVDGHTILTQEEYDQFTLAAANVKHMYFCIGTNEDIEYGIGQWDSKIEDAYTVEEITEAEAKVLRKLDLAEAGFARKFYYNLVETYAEQRDEE